MLSITYGRPVGLALPWLPVSVWAVSFMVESAAPTLDTPSLDALRPVSLLPPIDLVSLLPPQAVNEAAMMAMAAIFLKFFIRINALL